MPAPTPPFYADWTFWSFLAAAIAIALSQLPPIRLLLRKSKLELEPHSKVSLHHSIGYPYLAMYIDLSNSGGRAIRIKGLKVSVRRDGADVFTLPSQSFFDKIGDQQQLLLVPFTLKPDEHWGHIVAFFHSLPQLQEREVKSARSNIRDDILPQVQRAEASGFKPAQWFEASAPHVAEILAIFEKAFDWSPGSYEFDVGIDSEPANVFAGARFAFILYESDTKDLRSYAADYKYGQGVYFTVPKHEGVYPTVRAI